MASDWKDKFYSKDGKYYDSLVEAKAADEAWDKQIGLQKEQNRLIEEQNIILQQVEYDRMNQEIEIENSRQQLQREQMLHEKEMRLLKLFDDVGISKELYDVFIDKTFNGKDVSIFNKTKRNLDQKAKLLDLCLLYENDMFNSEIENLRKNNQEKYDQLVDLVDELTADCYIKADSKYLEKHNEYLTAKDKKKKYATYSIASFIACMLIIVIVAFAYDYNEGFGDFMMIMCSIGFIAFIYFVCVYSISYKRVEELNIFSDENYKQYDYARAEKNIKAQIKNNQKKLDEVNNQILPIIQSKIEEFYKFRINHYNSKIEKLLIDVGFKKIVEEYKLEYKTVNNNNKKKDGTVEDYIAYFENDNNK